MTIDIKLSGTKEIKDKFDKLNNATNNIDMKAIFRKVIYTKEYYRDLARASMYYHMGAGR